MKTHRRLRWLAALLTAASMLLSQVAIAAFACPGPEAMAALATSAGDPAMPCCGEAPDAEPALCQAHCQQGDRSLDKPAAPVPAAMVSQGALCVPAPLAAPPPLPPPGLQPAMLAHATAPSVAVRHCCFRI